MMSMSEDCAWKGLQVEAEAVSRRHRAFDQAHLDVGIGGVPAFDLRLAELELIAGARANPGQVDDTLSRRSFLGRGLSRRSFGGCLFGRRGFCWGGRRLGRCCFLSRRRGRRRRRLAAAAGRQHERGDQQQAEHGHQSSFHR
jgi:hypothetical protein